MRTCSGSRRGRRAWAGRSRRRRPGCGPNRAPRPPARPTPAPPAAPRAPVRRGERRHLQEETRLRDAVLAAANLALDAAQRPAPMEDLDLEPELVAGHRGPPELGVVDPDDVDLEPARVRRVLQEPDARGLG